MYLRPSTNSNTIHHKKTTIFGLTCLFTLLTVSSLAQATGRVSNGLIAEYDFSEGFGTVVGDTSGVLPALDLEISEPSKAEWTECGGLSLQDSTLISSAVPASKLIDRVMQTNEVTVEAWVIPSLDNQTGPARIVSLSSDGYERNFTLGQNESAAQMRLRTTTAGLNGTNDYLESNAGLALTSASPNHVVYTRKSSGEAKLFINGNLSDSKTIDGDLSNWDSTMRLALGNEFGIERPWLGEFLHVAVYERSLTSNEVQTNFNAGSTNGCDRTPEALFSMNKVIGETNLDVQFDASQSHDLEGSIVSYTWDFGDGSSATGLTANHTYALAGDYYPTLTVTDTSGKTDIASRYIKVLPQGTYNRIPTHPDLMFTFSEGQGSTVHNLSLGAENLDLTIQDPSKTAWKQCGGLAITGETQINSSESPSDFIDKIVASNAISIEAWVIPDSLNQTGPARIFSLSQSTGAANFVLGQENEEYLTRLRTTSTGALGAHHFVKSTGGQASNQLTHLVYTRATDGVANLYVNGNLAGTGTIPSTTSNWADNFLLGVGNEIGGQRPWLGEVYLLATYSHPLSDIEVAQNYNAGIISNCNIEPVAKFESDVRAGVAPLLVNFDASLSDDYDGNIVSYDWDFGDGTQGQGLQVAHSFSTVGAFDVTLTVTDDQGATHRVTHDIMSFPTGRTSLDQVLLYSFNEGSGNLIQDLSGVGAPLDLTLPDTGTSWLSCGGLSVDNHSFIGSTQSPTKLINSIQGSHEISIEAWIKPDNLTQTGPARIVTFSKDPYSRYFTFGQDADEYNVRLRTSGTSDNGINPSLTSEAQNANTVLTNVVYTRDKEGLAALYIDGVLVTTEEILGDINNWDGDAAEYLFGLGSEVDVSRSWLGDYHLVSVYSRALIEEEITHNYGIGISNTCSNSAPAITSTAVTSASENLSYSYPVIATDVDGDALQYSLSQSPVGAQIDNAGLITWTPAYNQSGDHSFTVQVSDANFTVAQSFTVSVVNTNRLPVMTSVELISGQENTLYSYDVNATDPDGDALTYLLAQGPQGMTIDSISGLVTWTPSYDQSGEHLISIDIVDSNGGAIKHEYTLLIANLNRAPIAQAQSLTLNEDADLSITLSGNDDDADTLAFSLMSSPASGSLSGTAPNLTYTPNANFSGSDSFSFRVNDGQVDSETVVVNLNVLAVNDAPEAHSQSLEMNENTSLSIVLTGADIEGDTLSYQLMTSPSNGVLSGDIPNLTYTPTADFVVNDSLTFTVSDGSLSSAPATISITVLNVNQAPEITSTPINFVLSGDTWTYELVATDVDGDDLTLSAPTLPENASFDAQSGQVTWPTVGLAPGEHQIVLSAEDAYGEVVQQNLSIEVISTERTVTHEGTEFRIPFSINVEFRDNRYHLFLVSNDADTLATLNIPLLGINEEFDLVKGVITQYTIDAAEVNAAGGYERNELLVNNAIHIQSDQKITVYVLNEKDSSTDGFLALPTSSWGKEYVVGHYTVIPYSDEKVHPVATIVADENNTIVSIKATMDMFFGENTNEHGRQQVNTGDEYTMELNAGDVYNLTAAGSNVADFTGTLIDADKPISVIGQNPCAYVPTSKEACDHLVEQLPPIESLGTSFVTAPLYGRGGRDATDHGFGDTFRIVAPYSETDIYIDGELRQRLNSQEYFEFLPETPAQRDEFPDTVQKALRIVSTKPVLLLQYSNGAQFENNDPIRQLLRETDPFMIVVPPVEQYLNEYTVHTPAQEIERNFINIMASNESIATLRMNGEGIDSDQFIEVSGSGYSYAQIEVAQGSYHLKSEFPFGVAMYGSDYYDSYGYLGGMAFSLPDDVDKISLAADNLERTIGQEICLTASVSDASGKPVSGVRIEFVVQNAIDQANYAFSSAYGEAQYCYASFIPGLETVVAKVGNMESALSIHWQETADNLPPVITSVPNLKAPVGARVEYQVRAFDPNGDELTYRLVEGHYSMTLDEANGLLVWPSAGYSNNYTRRVIIEVEDEHGAVSKQQFMFEEWFKPFNTPPEFTEVEQGTTGTVGVPYVYNIANLESSLEHKRYLVPSTDAEGDVSDMFLIDGPEGAYFDNHGGQYPVPEPWALTERYFRWTPNALGNYQFEIAMRDSRGAFSQEKRYLNVQVAPNLPPEIVSLTPPTKAVVGHEYVYLVNIENDIPLGKNSNLDALNLVIESGPEAMTVEQVDAGIGQNSQFYLSWTPDADDVGEKLVRIRAEDRVNSSDVQEFSITVIGDNQPPVINSSANQDAEVSIPYGYQIQAVDPDGDSVSYELMYGPEGMSINSSGFVSWVPTEDQLVHAPPAETDYKVWVAVLDGKGGQSIQEYIVGLVKFSNRPPEFLDDLRITKAQLGVEYVVQVVARDREGDDFNYEPYYRNDVEIVLDQRGVIRWTPTEIGRFQIGVVIRDSQGRAVVEKWYVDVIDGSEVPDVTLELSNKPLSDAYVGQAYQYRFFGDSSLGGKVNASLVKAPQGMTISPNQPYEGAYEINWIPDEADCVHDVEIVLMDEYGNSQSVNYTIDVHNAPKKLNRFQCSLDNELCAAP